MWELDCKIGDGQGGLVCGSPWSRKELDMTERLNWTESTQISFQSRKKSDQNLTDPTAVAQGNWETTGCDGRVLHLNRIRGMNHNTQYGWVSEVISGAPYCEQGPVENWCSYLVNDSSVFNNSFSTNYDKIHFLHDVATEMKNKFLMLPFFVLATSPAKINPPIFSKVCSSHNFLPKSTEHPRQPLALLLVLLQGHHDPFWWHRDKVYNSCCHPVGTRLHMQLKQGFHDPVFIFTACGTLFFVLHQHKTKI